MWQIIKDGGWLMLPILVCSVISLAIIIERVIFYARYRVNAYSLLQEILRFVGKNRIKEAVETCERKPSYLTNVLKAGLIKYDQSKEVIKESMEDVSLYEVPRLERNLIFLSTIAHISPLLGLLGTVVGMIRCFNVVQEKALEIGMVNPSDLARGIYEALITTAAGLCVAIPAYLAYNYFVHRVNSCVLEMERAATELLEVLSERSYVREII